MARTVSALLVILGLALPAGGRAANVPTFGVVKIAPLSAAADPTKPPNVLFIAVDDLNHWVGHLGRNKQTKTPNIDRLARIRTLKADPCRLVVTPIYIPVGLPVLMCLRAATLRSWNVLGLTGARSPAAWGDVSLVHTHSQFSVGSG